MGAGFTVDVLSFCLSLLNQLHGLGRGGVGDTDARAILPCEANQLLDGLNFSNGRTGFRMILKTRLSLCTELSDQAFESYRYSLHV